MSKFWFSLMGAALIASPASAHPGDHASMTVVDIVQHYAEPDHLAFLALTVIVGWLCFRGGRRVEAKARATSQRRERP